MDFPRKNISLETVCPVQRENEVKGAKEARAKIKWEREMQPRWRAREREKDQMVGGQCTSLRDEPVQRLSQPLQTVSPQPTCCRRNFSLSIFQITLSRLSQRDSQTQMFASELPCSSNPRISLESFSPRTSFTKTWMKRYAAILFLSLSLGNRSYNIQLYFFIKTKSSTTFVFIVARLLFVHFVYTNGNEPNFSYVHCGNQKSSGNLQKVLPIS